MIRSGAVGDDEAKEEQGGEQGGPGWRPLLDGAQQAAEDYILEKAEALGDAAAGKAGKAVEAAEKKFQGMRSALDRQTAGKVAALLERLQAQRQLEELTA